MNILKLTPLITRYFNGNNLSEAISIDVTQKCNLKCKHCYFYNYGKEVELNDEKFLARLKELKQTYPLVHASWIGGEPLLRKDLVEEGMKLFPLNMVVTNGTLKLPSWNNCVFNVSVDGTKEYYEKVRGPYYDLVKKNADRKDIKVNLTCVLSRLNADCIEPLLEEWSKTYVRGIGFSFYTPIEGMDKDICLTLDERDVLIDKLLKLKKTKYKGFIINSGDTLSLMKSENVSEVTERCLVPKMIYSMQTDGKRKPKCMLGRKADCSKCGCMIAYGAANKPTLLKKMRGLMFFKNMFTQL